MLNTIKTNDLQIIKVKFIAIYILNAVDILFTLFLLTTGLFFEGNILMAKVVENNMLSLVLKLVVPMIMLIIMYIRIKQASIRQLRVGKRIINCCIVFYTLVNISHLYWIISYKAYLL